MTSSRDQQSGFGVFFKDEGIESYLVADLTGLTPPLSHRSVPWTAAALLPLSGRATLRPGKEARSAGDDRGHLCGPQGWPRQGGNRTAAVQGGFVTDSRASQVPFEFGIKVALKEGACVTPSLLL